MAQNHNSISGQKRVRCANHNSIIECDGRVGPDEGSKYCADCRTQIDVVCAGCQTMFSMPRGLHQILCAQNKIIKCYACLHGNGGSHEVKPAAEGESNDNPKPRRKEPKEPRIVICTLKRKGICVAADSGQPFNQMYRLDRKLSPGGLRVLVRGIVCEDCAESVKADFPDAIFCTAGGRPLPHHHPLGHPHHPEVTHRLLREELSPVSISQFLAA